MKIVLDGTNIALLHGPAKTELRYPLAIACELGLRGARVSCFFDANTPYLISDVREMQRPAFDTLTHSPPWADCFHVVPGGTQADEIILENAKRDGALVISNDRFKDRARAHRWIYKRRHGLYIANDLLQVPGLDISINIHLELLAQPEDYLPRLRALCLSA